MRYSESNPLVGFIGTLVFFLLCLVPGADGQTKDDLVIIPLNASQKHHQGINLSSTTWGIWCEDEACLQAKQEIVEEIRGAGAGFILQPRFERVGNFCQKPGVTVICVHVFPARPGNAYRASDADYTTGDGFSSASSSTSDRIPMRVSIYISIFPNNGGSIYDLTSTGSLFTIRRDEQAAWSFSGPISTSAHSTSGYSEDAVSHSRDAIVRGLNDLLKDKHRKEGKKWRRGSSDQIAKAFSK